MNTNHKRHARLAAGSLLVIGLAGGGFYAGTALAAGTPEPSSVPGLSSSPEGTPGAAKVSAFPVNSNGQTYGSSEDVAIDDLPDLILAEATNGRMGYVNRELLDELTGANVSSPEEAVAWNEKMDAATWETKQIPVYLLDGVTQIGTFEISRSQGSMR